jgi:hypothetical protein
MRQYEDDMLRFSKPFFTEPDKHISLSLGQHMTFVGWVSLITVLAEYIDHKGSVCVQSSDLKYIKRNLQPPQDTWTIAACSSDAPTWAAKYRHHASFTGQFSNIIEYHSAVARGVENNTQISSFGIGKLFIQTRVKQLRSATY